MGMVDEGLMVIDSLVLLFLSKSSIHQCVP